MPTLACQPKSRGHDLDPEGFGFLSDSSAFIDDIPRLHRAMEEDGYLFLRGFFRREDVVAAREVVTDRLLAAGILDPAYSPMEGRLAKVTVVNERSAFVPGAMGEIVPVKSYNADDLTRTNQPLKDLLTKGRVIDFFSKYLGGPARRLNYIWFRAVGRGMGTQPHCDWVYMSRGTPRLFTTWVPLGDTPLEVGGLMILENSHRQAGRLKNYLSRDVDTYCTSSPNAEKLASGEMMFEWDGSLSKNPATLQKKLGGRWLTAEYEMGDLLIFSMRTVHASLDNQSDRIRISVDTRYQLQSDPIDERFASENPVPYAREYKKGRIC
jgi:ectoine hydroxylase-related dioxygenase (phytanoyl-CoA dioxygenase family)